jgi:transcriptional regulator with XRE-family HTH domain
MTHATGLTTLLLMVDKDTKGMPIKYPEFAARVQDGMKKQGLTTGDVKQSLGITYEMARRYTLGQAMPRQEKMQILAAALHVDPAMLQYGEAKDNFHKTIKLSTRSDWPFSVSKQRFDRLPKDEKERIDGLIEHTITAWEHRIQTKSGSGS